MWLINGNIFSGTVVTVGTGQSYSKISSALSSVPNGDILVLYYNGSENEIIYTSNTRAIYVKGMVSGASVEQIDVGTDSPVNVFGFEGLTFNYSGLGTQSLGSGFFSKCIANSGNAFWSTVNGDTSNILITNCTTTGTTIVSVGSSGYTAANTQVVKTQCAPVTAPGSQYPAIFGIIKSADYVTANTNGYGSGYGSDYISNVVLLTVTPSNSAMRLGASQQFTAIATYGDGSTQDVTSMVSWSSSNSNVTISNGLAHSLTTGITTITATMGSLSGTALISVVSSSPTTLASTNKMFTGEITRDINGDFEDKSEFIIENSTPFPFTVRGIVFRLTVNQD